MSFNIIRASEQPRKHISHYKKNFATCVMNARWNCNQRGLYSWG